MPTTCAALVIEIERTWMTLVFQTDIYRILDVYTLWKAIDLYFHVGYVFFKGTYLILPCRILYFKCA